jgi:peptidoglycan hydrolase-like protein with peptidoglycan-binding domain
MVIAFQKDHGIIQSSTEESAWVYGPKTKSTLAKEHAQYVILRDSEIQKIESEKALLISARNEWESSYAIASMKVSAIGSPKRGESWTHISSLQKTLKTKGYFRWKENGVMSGSTILAVKSLQKSYGINQTGTIDSATKDILLAVIAESV